MRFWKCFCFFMITGVLGFLAGRIIPKKWLRPGHGLFRCFAFEKEGKLYEKLGIRKWHKRVPDMSRLLPSIMPAKNLMGDYRQRLPLMLQETCVAEVIHSTLCIAGLYCLKLWPGFGGVVVYLLYALFFNVPYVLIQRYNRPRLMKLYQKLLSKQSPAEGKGATP